MRIAVISPHASNNGNTTLAMLLALEFSSQQKLTCITHIKPTSESFQTYLNFKPFNDKTSTPSQIVKILKSGTLTASDVRSYCKQVNEALEVFTNESSNFSADDMAFMYKYIAKVFPHEHVIFDVDSDDLGAIERVINYCDVVVMNCTQSIKDLSTFNRNKKEILDSFIGRPTIVVINRYISTQGSLKEVAKWMGLSKPNNFLVLHENPWITWATNHGQLNILFRKISQKDPRVIELQTDLSKICNTIVNAKKAYDKNKITKKQQ